MFSKVKNELRNQLRIRRQNISQENRKQASYSLLNRYQNVKSMTLAFASFGDEIDLWNLNTLLAKKGILIFPKVEKTELKLYRVEHFSRQLSFSKLGILEPISQRCEKICPAKIELALIPGLGFDRKHHRLGYGKGYYDLLIPKLVNALKIGIGFKEQLLDFEIPIELHDQPLDQIAITE